MMKKSFFRLTLLVFTLAMSLNPAWAALTIGTPADWYYVNFTTSVSTPSCGNTAAPGLVKLNFTDTDREQDNQWITGIQPVNPYLSDYEKYEDFNKKWGEGSERGRQEAETQSDKSDYPTDEEGVTEWSAEQIQVAKDGYDAGWAWQKETSGDWSKTPFPLNPYDEQYSRYESLQDQWKNGFDSGVNTAKEGNEKEYPDLSYMNDWKWAEEVIKAYKEAYAAGYAWYKAGRWLNNYREDDKDDYATEWGTSASLNGYAMVHMDGMDSVLRMSSYAYFEAKVKENDGWYFAGWSYTEGDYDLGGHVDTDKEEDKGYLFKIYPSNRQGWEGKSQEYAYATFKPVMISDYKVGGIINGTNNATMVTFDAVGERVEIADFTVACAAVTDGDSGGNWSVEITSCTDNKVVVTVAYTGSANGEFRGNVTLASKSGCSQLTAPVYARVGITGEKEASLYNNKVSEDNYVESGNLTELITQATENQIVALNADYDKELTISNAVTIFTNGYTISTLKVTAGTVTFAYDKYNGGAQTVSVTGGTLSLNGGTFGSLTIKAGATVEQNGATFTDVATNHGTLTTTDGTFEKGLTSDGTLTINNGAFYGETTALTVSGGTAVINRGTIEGNHYGLHVKGGTATVKKLVAIKGSTNAVLQEGGYVDIECGKFNGTLSTVRSFTSGYFVEKTHAVNVETGKEWMQLTSGVEYNEGYRFFLGDSETAKTNGVGVCRIGETSYATLEKALDYANSKPSEEDIIIFMTNNYVLPAGYYTLPKNATIVVPMSDAQQKINLAAPRLVWNDVNNAESTKYINNKPKEFRRLTFAKGVNLEVFGKIELTCTQYQSNEAYTSQPVGAYGRLVMEEGSHMTLQSGSELRAWGFVTGKGEIDARRDATVREMFQMGDWKGAMTSVKITGMGAPLVQDDYSSYKIFPVTQYFIQNVEAPVKYHPGALLSTSATVSEGVFQQSVSMAATDIAIVGVSNEDEAIFLMDIAADAENTWVRKWYDVENDIQVYEINSGAHIGSMVLDMGGLSLGGFTLPVRLNSAKFDLPITSNFKIHLLTGTMDFLQNTSLLPGSEVEVDKESTVTISMDKDDPEHTGALYVYDSEQWQKYAYNTKYTKVVPYTPSALNGQGGQPDLRDEDTQPASAKINVHGTFNTLDGYVYTSAGGADIFSSNEDAGTFIFNNAASEAGERTVYQILGSGSSISQYKPETFTCARLKNSDDSYTETTNAVAQMAFIYKDGKWQEPFTETSATLNMDCYTAEINLESYQEKMNDAAQLANIAIYHAPQNIAEYLVAKPIVLAMTDFEGDFTAANYEWVKHSDDEYQPSVTYKQAFESYAETITEGVKNIKETGYDLGSVVQKLLIKPQEWVEIAGTVHAKFDISDDDVKDFGTLYEQGVQSGTYSQCGDAVEAYIAYCKEQASHPHIETVEGNDDHTYSDADGAGRLFILAQGEFGDQCQWWEVEKDEKSNLYHCIHPNNDTYYEWDEDAGIDGTWMEKQFTITWKNWNGDPVVTADADGTLQPDGYSVPYGTMAEFLGTNPTREADIDYTYDFTGWSPALGPVTEDITYTATYEQKERKYTITFLNEGGTEIERQFLKHNEVPVCENVPTRTGYTLEWSPAIAAVTGEATYTATWLEEPPTEYAVTFYDFDGKKLKPAEGEDSYMVKVGDLPTPPANPTGKTQTDEYTYVFDHWSPAPEKVSATSVKSYVAVYREEPRKYFVTFQNEDGSVIETNEYEYGATPVCSNTPTKAKDAQFTYTLVWYPQIETVREDVTYTATFPPTTNKYTVTLKSNPSGACTFTGAGTFDYGTKINISATANDGYSFLNWTDENGNEVKEEELPTEVKGRDITLVANFTYQGDDYVTILWKSEDGKTTLATSKPKIGTATTYTGPKPTKQPERTDSVFTFYGWSTEANGNGDNIYKNGMTPKAETDATYYAYFNREARKYTISWKNEDGTDIEVDYNQPYGTSVEYNSATPTKHADAQYTYTFDGWATEPKGGKAPETGAAPTVTGDAAYYAHFAAEAISVPVVETELIIHPAEQVTITSYTLTDEFIIESDGSNSGQLIGAENLHVHGDAYFDLTMSFQARTWYAVAVPWQVSMNGGVIAGDKPLQLGSTFNMIYYNSENRAAHGKSDGTYDCWTFMTNSDVMEPGKLYMMYVASPTEKIRFRKVSGAPVQTTELSVHQYPQSTGNETDAGWNGIANPALFHAYLNTSASTYGNANFGQKYIPGEDRYDAVDMSSDDLIVGEPIFVQVAAEKTVMAYTNWSEASAHAPRRAPIVDNAYYELRISAGEDYTDRLYLQTLEDKEDRYVIGLDLAKAGVSNKVAQMWVERYNARLCVNTTAPVGKTATYPLGIAIPETGTYQITSASGMQPGQQLYVTRNGSAIWNLAYGPYTVTLDKGTYSEYGIKLIQSATTDIDPTADGKLPAADKLIIDNHVYILRDGELYTITGQKVN